ncbi:MAG: hypothetical protein E7393_03705 [Ruminococcaceae bacterium]|nr:hypothetical protein [Oscillospiraceae bacterium]
MKEKHIVWSDIHLDFEDWRDDLQEQYPEASEDELIYRMYETNNDYLSDERVNLDIQLSQSIIVIGDLGLWHGRVQGYKMIESGNIKDCLYSDCDMNEWYVDKNGDFRCTAVHHDGWNHYLYRAFKDNITDTQRENLQEKLYAGTATRRDITRYTKRLGDDIGAVYGWTFPQRTHKEVER